MLPAHIPSHVNKEHKSARLQVDKIIIAQAVEEQDLCTTWPQIPSSPIPIQYQGLESITALCCPVCPSILNNLSSLKRHGSKVHNILLSANGRYHTVDAQRLSKHPDAHSWFRVHHTPPPSITPFTTYLSGLRKELDIPAVLAPTEIDHRQVNPWQASTRWNQWVATQDPALMVQLVEYPKADSDLANLASVVQHFLNRAYKFIPVAGELCCQVLNTETQTRYAIPY